MTNFIFIGCNSFYAYMYKVGQSRNGEYISVWFGNSYICLSNVMFLSEKIIIISSYFGVKKQNLARDLELYISPI